MAAKKIFNFAVYLFALAGFVLVAGFFAVRFGLTNVPGVVDKNNSSFKNNNSKVSSISDLPGTPQVLGDLTVASVSQEIDKLSKIKQIRQDNYCKIKVIGNFYPENAKKIIEVAEKTKSDSLVMRMIQAIELRLEGNANFESQISACGNSSDPKLDYLDLKNSYANANGANVFDWIGQEEWSAIKQATLKDKDLIYAAGEAANIEPRIVVSNMIVEQLRLFYSEREVFKKFFGPLKILCSANKISLGVMGIKEDTAKRIENNLKDQSCPFYLGKQYENLLDYGAGSGDSQRYDRLASEKDHYYSYLYGALYIKQIMKQWQDAGYDITYRPEIIGTLFNVGFPQSKPNPDPKVGGSHITVNGKEYSFGALAYEFYYSGEMSDDFPYEIK